MTRGLRQSLKHRLWVKTQPEQYYDQNAQYESLVRRKIR
jgi:hypothetical protein